jgi:predicted secreted protein
MAYSISSAFAIYFVLWWIVLFVTLPFGVRSQSEDGDPVPGSEHGAPIAPLMLKKLLWTTIVSAVIFAVSAYGYRAGYLNVDRLTRLMGIPF